ncbi:unnamed protein product [Enterobius vermicularis]|uniref:Tubulin--tyrosine ligase-like protein 5 n=1 Tax=Enterobius vermicularis TaxID=51028 RepID=A0A158Q947_ENTVE|nr:unnamed protein product [Enterobius vermicularis]
MASLVAEYFPEQDATPNTDTSNSNEIDDCMERHYPEYVTFVPSALNYIGKNGLSLSNSDRYTKIGEQSRMRFKMIKTNQLLVKTILYSYGFEQCSERNPNVNLIWSASHLSPYTLRSLGPWQRVNHFPRSSELTRKDKLYENVARARRLFGNAFDFIPDFFVSPRELAAFTNSYNTGEVTKPFIVKPVASSCGHGIFIIRKPQEIPMISNLLVSEYISNPYLIDGHKFDLRIYVLVTSFHPLTVYIYKDGLARFASEKYSKEDSTFEEQYCHLTNYSLNKFSDHFIRNKCATDEDSGHKWTLGAALRRMKVDGVDTKLLMVRIESIVLKTLISVQGSITARCRNLLLHSKCCFELFGFDILIDSDLKPWLLEVNLSPSLVCDSPLDLQLKSALVCDTLTLAAIPLVHGRCPDNSLFQPFNCCCFTFDSEENLVSTLQFGRVLMSWDKGAMLSKRSFSYNANRPSQSYERKARFLLERFKIEEQRHGGFVCIFPRRNSWKLYSCFMEDVGLEKWDYRLNRDLFGSEAVDSVDKYPTLSSLSDDTRQLLAEAVSNVSAYERRLTVAGVKYAAKLPRVRPEARKRSLSFMKSEEDLHDITKNGITTSSADDLQSKPVDGINSFPSQNEVIDLGTVLKVSGSMNHC